MIRKLRNLKVLAVLISVLMLTSISAFAGNFILKYEQVVTDSYGNEVGYRTKTISNINQLPEDSPWRDYLNLKLDSGKTIYEYASGISKSLNKNFTLTLSDRDSNSYSYKNNSSYCVNLYTYVNNYASDASKKFLFLHEFGHSTMLNSYPANYDFNNLDYGTDGAHYLDEILPNYNTAWVEGWANAFGAYNNNGMVFSVDMKDNSSLSFLKSKTFDQASRNELFVCKTIYDLMKDLPNGQTSVYDAFAKTGPHTSLYEFCNAYVKLYPENKAALAEILMNNSQGNATLNDILLYVNGGSKTVSRELYNYLSKSGLLTNTTTATGNGQIASNQNTTTTTTTKKKSFISRIFDWFGNLFGNIKETVASKFGASGPKVEVKADPGYTTRLDGNLSVKGSVSAASPSTQTNIQETAIGDGSEIAAAQEEYYKYFAEYNKLISDTSNDANQINLAAQKMNTAKLRLKALQSR